MSAVHFYSEQCTVLFMEIILNEYGGVTDPDPDPTVSAVLKDKNNEKWILKNMFCIVNTFLLHTSLIRRVT